MRRTPILSATLLFLLSPQSLLAISLFVPDQFPTIQAAIDEASSGDVIQVAAGTYAESIRLKSGVEVRGAGVETTFLVGDGSEAYVLSESWGLHPWVVYGADHAQISGFTITSSEPGEWPYLSIGILNWEQAANASQNVITGNGFGLINFRSAALISDNTISDNFYGILNHYVANSTITRNWIEDNFYGIMDSQYPVSEISSNVIVDNYFGVASIGATSQIVNNTIVGNYFGARLYYGYAYTPPSLSNNILSDNDFGIFNSSGRAPSLSHNLLWNNEVDYSGVEPSPTDLYEDPGFEDPTSRNYRLASASSCIDSGTESPPGLPELDFAGNPRRFDGDGDLVRVVDIGAFEYRSRHWSQPPQPSLLSPENGASYLGTEVPIVVGFAPTPFGIGVVEVTFFFNNEVVYAGPPEFAPPSLDLSVALPGEHIFGVGAVDNFGNVTSTPTTVNFTYSPSVATLAEITEEQLSPLVGVGQFTQGNLDSLYAKLSSAQALLESGNVPAAEHQLVAFLHQVDGFVRAGKLDSSLRDLLAAYVSSIVENG